MAYGSSSQISYLGTMATGALEDGNGLTQGTKELVALTKATANGHLQLIGNARRSQCVAYAFNAPIQNKDILKSNKYRWNPNKKVWHRTIDRTQLEDERLWLEENVYDGNFTGQFIEITPADKYKE